MHRQQGPFLSVHIDDINMSWKKHHLELAWKRLMKHVDLEKPTTFLDQVYLGWIQRECGPDSSLVDGYRKMFESRMSAGATEKLPDAGKVDANVIPWSYDMEGHAKKCVERHCESAKKTSSHCMTSPHVASTITGSRKRSWKRWENCQQFSVKSSSNGCIWRASTDLTFFGLRTRWREQSRNGQEPVTDV